MSPQILSILAPGNRFDKAVYTIQWKFACNEAITSQNDEHWLALALKAPIHELGIVSTLIPMYFHENVKSGYVTPIFPQQRLNHPILIGQLFSCWLPRIFFSTISRQIYH